MIVVTGIPRSGSTMAFNATRLLCANSDNSKKTVSSWINDFKWNFYTGRSIVLKIHHYDWWIARIPGIFIHTTRDLHEVAASLKSIGNSLTVKLLTAIHRDDKRWVRRADLTFDHNTIVRHPESVVVAIAKKIDKETENIDDLIRELESIRLSKNSNMDPITQMHPGHVTQMGKEWRSVLSTEWIDKIEGLKCLN